MREDIPDRPKETCRKLPELLAPAGNRKGFYGALKAGADAFYLGGEKFGARAYAENFTVEELIQTIHEAHLFDKKVYLTVNVLTKESEYAQTLDFVETLYKEGLDGVIVQDLGVLAGLRERCPGLLLHASTQMSVTGPEAVRFLKEFGVCRIVPARELSLQEIIDLKAEEPIEIEAFIHGAMCYSYSGRCLMSSFLGGRSGNRGRCAGTCRLPYTIFNEYGRPPGRESHRESQKGNTAGRIGHRTHRGQREKERTGARSQETYPLSMRDLCVLEILPELIDAGIDSFKIEGRMKKPEYAAGTTAFYRKYIDRYVQWDAEGRREPWRVDPDDLKALHALYIRAELSTGYYHRRNGRELLTMDRPGYAGAEEGLLLDIDGRFLEKPPLRSLCGHARFVVGEPAALSIDTEGSGQKTDVEVTGEVVQAARSQPLRAEDIKKRLCKTGDTLFRFEELKIETDEKGFLPVSSLNALRREALGAAEKKILEDYKTRNDRETVGIRDISERVYTDRRKVKVPEEDGAGALWAQVMTVEQLDASLRQGMEHLILEETPELMKWMEEPEVRRMQRWRSAQNPMYECSFYLALPHVCRPESRRKIQNLLNSENRQKYTGFLVRNLEELVLLRETEYSYEIIADGSLYQWNRGSQALLLRDCDRLVLPWELSEKDLEPLVKWPEELAGIGSRELLTVYGRLPMMVTAGCVRRTEGICSGGPRKRSGQCTFASVMDRKGVCFPVRCVCEDCYNVIYNSLPQSLHQFVNPASVQERSGRSGNKSAGIFSHIGGILCSFTTESGEETARVLRYFGGEDQAGPPVTEYTNGHFRRSAL